VSKTSAPLAKVPSPKAQADSSSKLRERRSEERTHYVFGVQGFSIETTAQAVGATHLFRWRIRGTSQVVNCFVGK